MPPSAFGLPFIGDTFSTIALGPVAVGRKRDKQLGKFYRGVPGSVSLDTFAMTSARPDVSFGTGRGFWERRSSTLETQML